MVSQYETTIQAVHSAARTHTQRSVCQAATGSPGLGLSALLCAKARWGPAVAIAHKEKPSQSSRRDLTSELLHCLSTLPDPWPLAKITMDMEKTEPMGLKVVQTLLC